jgi:hypothetical protein
VGMGSKRYRSVHGKPNWQRWRRHGDYGYITVTWRQHDDDTATTSRRHDDEVTRTSRRHDDDMTRT